MHRRLLPFAAVSVFALGLFGAACGDGPEDSATPSPTTAAAGATSTQTSSTSSQAWPGPAPRIGDNVTAITPLHGAKVTQESTQTTNPERPRGVCFEANFEGLSETGRWFQIVVDDKLVTEELKSIVPSLTEEVKQARACFAPPEGLAEGRHTAAVSVQNPNNFNEPPKQLVSWAFEVE